MKKVVLAILGAGLLTLPASATQLVPEYGLTLYYSDAGHTNLTGSISILCDGSVIGYGRIDIYSEFIPFDCD